MGRHDEMNTNAVPRESVEFQPITITVDGAAVTTGVTFAIAATGTRPTTWVDPVTLGGNIGIMLTGLTPGLYRVWATVASSPETVVIDCGYLSIT
jgi:hypothetical protein